MDGGALLFCVLVLLVHCGSEATAITVFSNSSSDFLVGRNISLIISYSFNAKTTVSWSKNGFQIAYRGDSTNITTLPEYFGRLDIIGKGSLVINNSTHNDTGNYTVSVNALGETEGSLAFPVKIYDPVQNASVSQSPEAVGESTPLVNLSCSASSGGVTYTWTRGGQLLTSNGSYVILEDGRILQISHPNRTVNGNYTCNVSNPVDWEEATRMLNVSYSDKMYSLSGGAIAGIVIGVIFGVILLILLIIAIIFCVRKRRNGDKKKKLDVPHKEAIRTVSGTTLSPDDPAYFTLNNIMYRSSSISMGSCVNYGDNTSDYLRNPSPKPAPNPSNLKVKHATQV